MSTEMKLYHLRANAERIVVGTDEHFADLARGTPGGFAPYAEFFGDDLVPPRRAASWAEAKEALLADWREG